MTDAELVQIVTAIEEIVANIQEWQKPYRYDAHSNEFYHREETGEPNGRIEDWFSLSTDPVTRNADIS